MVYKELHDFIITTPKKIGTSRSLQRGREVDGHQPTTFSTLMATEGTAYNGTVESCPENLERKNTATIHRNS